MKDLLHCSSDRNGLFLVSSLIRATTAVPYPLPRKRWSVRSSRRSQKFRLPTTDSEKVATDIKVPLPHTTPLHSSVSSCSTCSSPFAFCVCTILKSNALVFMSTQSLYRSAPTDTFAISDKFLRSLPSSADPDSDMKKNLLHNLKKIRASSWFGLCHAAPARGAHRVHRSSSSRNVAASGPEAKYRSTKKVHGMLEGGCCREEDGIFLVEGGGAVRKKDEGIMERTPLTNFVETKRSNEELDGTRSLHPSSSSSSLSLPLLP
mmetsp:Transcript_33169/g.76509  ORF Transcript_33169/g.76509 Transcript_33169/m.76509 type:complete len:262 (+) Transcript_33169:817-1602(+)